MNNKGFTLIELLAVIIILIGIAGVSVASITSSLERNEKKECERQRDVAVSAAKIYFSLNRLDGLNNSVEVRELVTKKIIAENTDVSGIYDAVVIINNGKYTLELDEQRDSCNEYLNLSEVS